MTRFYIITCSILLFVINLQAQKQCFDGNRKHRPYYEIAGYPRNIELNLLEREYSQSVHFGFGMGLNIFDFTRIKLSNQTVYVPDQGNVLLFSKIIQPSLGFNINAVMDYRLVKNFNIRFLPGIFFGKRNLDFYRQDTKTLVTSMPISSNYIEFPLLFKYSAMRFTNFRPYILFGGNMRINLSNKPAEDAKRLVGLKKVEYFAETGFGFDFYFMYFRMATELKFSAGLTNALSDETIEGFEYYRNSLEGIRSNMLILTLSFEL